MEVWKNPIKSKLHGYWLKSNEDTFSDNSIVCFTKPYAPDFVYFDASAVMDEHPLSSFFSMYHSTLIEDKTFLIVRLEDFLTYYFPQFGPTD